MIRVDGRKASCTLATISFNKKLWKIEAAREYLGLSNVSKRISYHSNFYKEKKTSELLYRYLGEIKHGMDLVKKYQKTNETCQWNSERGCDTDAVYIQQVLFQLLRQNIPMKINNVFKLCMSLIPGCFFSKAQYE